MHLNTAMLARLFWRPCLRFFVLLFISVSSSSSRMRVIYHNFCQLIDLNRNCIRFKEIYNSVRFFISTIGWRFENGLTSNFPSSYTNACMGWDRRTSSTNSADQLISRLDSDCTRPRLHHWLSAELDSPLSAMEPSRSSLLVSRAICHSTSLLHLLFTFMHLGWKPTSSPFPFRNFSISFPEQFWMYNACEVTSSLDTLIDHLTYLLTTKYTAAHNVFFCYALTATVEFRGQIF